MHPSKVSDKELQQLFGEKLSGMEAPVDPGLWAGIQSGLGSAAGSSATGASAWSLGKIFLAAAIAGTVAVGTWLIWPSEQAAPVEQTTQPLQDSNELEESESAESAGETTGPAQAALTEEAVEPAEVAQNVPDQIGTIPAQSTEPGAQASEVPSVDSEMTSPTEPITPSVTVELSEEAAPTVQPQAEATEVTAVKVVRDENDPLTFHFSAQTTGENQVIWEFGDGYSASGNQLSHTYQEEGEYQPLIQSAQNLTDVPELESVKAYLPSVIVLPNIFTPVSSPGLNDFYGIDFEQSSRIADYRLRIYNTGGELLFESNDDETSWDGADRFGNSLPSGSYFAVAEAWNKAGERVVVQQTLYLKR